MCNLRVFTQRCNIKRKALSVKTVPVNTDPIETTTNAVLYPGQSLARSLHEKHFAHAHIPIDTQYGYDSPF